MITKQAMYRKVMVAAIFSLIFAFFFTLGSKIIFSGNIKGSWQENYMKPFVIGDVFLFLFISMMSFVLFWLLIHWLQQKQVLTLFVRDDRIMSKKGKRIFYISIMICLLIAWLPYLLACFPGSILGDSLSSIRQIKGINPWSNHHPVLYTLFVGMFIQLGELLHSMQIGAALYSITQMMIMSATLSYALLWLYQKGIQLWMLVLAFGFYVITPIFGSYSIIMWKDPIYSCALFWYMFLLYEAMQSKGLVLAKTTFLLKYISTCIIIIFFRNNGIYIVGICTLILLFRYLRNAKRFAIVSLSMMIGSILLTNVIYGLLHIQKESVEAFGIPLQQMANVVVTQGDMDSNEEQFLFKLLPREVYTEAYRPTIVDPLKWHDQFQSEFLEAHISEFLKTWLTLLPKNFDRYVQAYCMETFGFWKLGVQNAYGYIDMYIADNEFGLQQIDMFEQTIGISVHSILENIQLEIGSGTLAWITILSLCLIIVKQRKAYLILLPALLNFLVILVASPVAFSMRYVYIFALALPFIMLLPCIVYKEHLGQLS